MRHNQDSHYWTPERRRQECRDAILTAAGLLALIAGMGVWISYCDVHQQVQQAAPVCQMTTQNQGFCDE